MADRTNGAARDGGDDQKSAFATAAQAFGLFAGIATILYIVGGLVVGLRLWYAGLPVWAVVNQLPRELLITEALVYVAAPLGLVALGNAGASGFARARRRLPEHPLHLLEVTSEIETARQRRAAYLYALSALLVIATIAWRSGVFSAEFSFALLGRSLALAVVVGVMTTVLAAASAAFSRRAHLLDVIRAVDEAERRRAEASEDVRTEDQAETLRTDYLAKQLDRSPPIGLLVLHGAWFTLPLLPIFVALGSVVTFPTVKACAAEAKYARIGQLVSHSSETLYVGFKDEEVRDPVIVAIPMGRLEEAVIASNPRVSGSLPDDTPRCDPPPVDADADAGSGAE